MDAPQEDFKWFGEGFDGFPKRLPEDTVEYVIHIINSKLAEAQIRSRLNEILQTANDFTKKLLRDYIWQREAFALTLKREENTWILRGRTNYGDSVSDEWLIVYILRELSRKYPDAWTRVYDSDGEFLLIEAANALPRWLNPEIADNRIWINKGQLRIIPLEKDTPSTRNLTVKQALNFISSTPSELIHSPLLEEEAFYRIRNYPDTIQDSLHHSQMTIPRRLAYILHQNPSYISPAIEAFYLRDPISLRPLQALNSKALILPPKDFVTTIVRFNKVGFAQLKSQEYPPPPTWKDEMPKVGPSKAEMGMKLTCGFEMMLSDPQNKDKKAVREIRLLLEDLDNGEERLPADAEISTWNQKEDDESWLDINFEDFEKELAGKNNPKATDDSTGFGDKAAQGNLRKMVERFEKFMNDEDAGAEGAEMDEMDLDDDEEEDSEGSDIVSDGEDKDVSFDEKEFAKMMREMMGLPPDEATRDGADGDLSDVEEVESEDEGEEIRKLSEAMEAELNEHGALNLDPTPRKIQATRGGKGKDKVKEANGDDGSDEEELDIDFNLAKNMLESFKGQSGMAGPAGNLMGLLDIKFPRDEPGKDEKRK
ncbi:putative regulatory factor Sgt1 [Tothia fuscella]|uniref:Regulatory factor Sgt1 n=1 Tax=Tothia fuscella TaxID=1048955 RepID=A0A9P4NWS8_9PEZI|nr:putative regulatory factor Sgt1 [Tothia fuscella]